MAQSYNQTLTNIRNYLADIQDCLNDLGLSGNQSISTWASQISGLVTDLNDQISADDSDFSDIYDAIVTKGQSPDEEDRDTYAPAILAISGGGSNLDTLNVTPTTSAQSLTPTSPVDGWDEVNVSAVTSAIDSNIQAGNIKNGVTILGVQGTYQGGGGSNYQQKSVTPDFSDGDYGVTADYGYDALSLVVVQPDSDLVASNIKAGVNLFGIVGQYGGTPVLQNKTVSPSTSQQSVQADNGYDGLDTVTVQAVTSSIDANIQAGNIKSGVQILGVTGSYAPSANYQAKSLEPDFSNGDVVVSPDSGYDALSSVTIEKDTDLVASNIKQGVTINGILGTYSGGGGGLTLNSHPLSLQYAGCMNEQSHTDALPLDGSWTTYVDLTNINAAQGLRYLFYNNTTITSVDLSGWDFSNITDFRYSFNGCSNLVTILGSIVLNKITGANYAFVGCTSLVNLPLKDFGFGSTTNTITLDLSSCASLDADTMIQNMNTNTSGKTRIIKLNATVYNNLSAATTAAAASKNITLQSA